MSIRLHRDELLFIGALAAANIVLNRLVPGDRSREIPAHVATAAAMVAVAGVISPPAPDEGAVRDNWRRGIATGLAVGVPIGTALTLAPSLPLTRRFFHDERIAGALPAEAAYHLFARIPIATALCEEVIFRFAVPRVLRENRGQWGADLIGAALFGLWHVLPTLDRMHSNPGTKALHRDSPARQTGVVAATVFGTAIAAFGLSRLRRVSNSITAPIIVHAAINGGGFLGGWLSARWAAHDAKAPTGDDAEFTSPSSLPDDPNR